MNDKFIKIMRIITLWLFVLIAQLAAGQSRKIIHIPDIPGYQTLKCDFHLHTVFSDGTVWPTVRVEEAWSEGLDAIAISDHLEYRPHSKDVVADHNRSFEIAEPLAETLNIILIRAAEITRSMPPGHFNALFIKNANLIDRDNVFDAIKEARDQGAFIFWNHPGWKVQQPDSTVWFEEHTRLLNSDQLHGIEVYNNNEFYPEALQWSADKKLTVLCNSDMHGPTSMSYNLQDGHRPLTLVFSKNKSAKGIREALVNKRTVAWFENTLAGNAEYLERLFFESVKLKNVPVHLNNRETRVVEIVNQSDLDYELELIRPSIGFDAPVSLVLKAHQITPLSLTGNSSEVAQMEELLLYYKVKNLITAPEKNLIITFSLNNK
ncbi:MAG: Sb-PDE family phosphodiesterase [Prolixibacteraceae bacterium]